MSSKIKSKSGFTIIEVVLVLAIAGLIFLMVFVAFPTLRSSQNDTRRQNDISRLSTQITNFRSNNSNGIPGMSSKNDNHNGEIAGGASIDSDSKVGTRGTWAHFYKNYLLANGATFEDPDGNAYNLKVVYCGENGDAAKPMKGVSDGADCQDSAQRYNTSFADQGHTILVVLGARCDGEVAVGASGARNIALVYKKEGGGAICTAN